MSLSNRLNISHQEAVDAIASLNDPANFMPHKIKLANGDEETIFEMTTTGIEMIEALYQS